MPDLILASASPRRRELLSLTGLTFTIDAAEVDEHTSLGAKEAVQELCRRKALAVASRHPGEIVLAADTLVAMHDIPFGKPEDEEDACRMLRSLSGKWHQVYTGVCAVSRDGQVFTGLDTSDVHFMDCRHVHFRSPRHTIRCHRASSAADAGTARLLRIAHPLHSDE